MNPKLISDVLVLLNVAAMAAVFIYSACSLSVKKWTWRQPELWIHALLIGGSVAVIGHTADSGQPHHLTEVLFNVAAACFFMLRSRRIHLLEGILRRKKDKPAAQGKLQDRAT